MPNSFPDKVWLGRALDAMAVDSDHSLQMLIWDDEAPAAKWASGAANRRVVGPIHLSSLISHRGKAVPIQHVLEPVEHVPAFDDVPEF